MFGLNRDGLDDLTIDPAAGASIILLGVSDYAQIKIDLVAIAADLVT